MNFGAFPTAPFIVALIIPIVYSLLNNKKELRTISLITICSVATVIFYPFVNFLSSSIPLVGYSIGKIVLFVIFPIVTVFYIERWGLKKILTELGVRRENLSKSIVYGLGAAVVTIGIVIVVSSGSQFDPVYRGIMFFEAFTEEFFFRGFLFLYLIGKTNRRIGYLTSVLGFALMHSQHFSSLFIIPTFVQGLLLTIVADKTKNVVGPWVSHGLNRFLPSLILSVV